MADPERLLDDPTASPFGRSLLEAAADDGPSAAGRARSAKRLGIVAGLGTTAAAGGTTTILAISAILVGLGVVAVVVLRGAAPIDPPVAPVAPLTAPAPFTPPPTPEPPVVPMVEAVAPTRSAPPKSAPHQAAAPVAAHARPPAIEPSSAAVPTSEPPSAVAPSSEVVPVEPEAPVAEPAPPAPVKLDARRLAAEVALLDRARAQLRRGDPSGALASLDDHDREFADGVLVAETTLVRIDALAKQGQTRAARDLATSFLTRFPRSPLVQRVRALLDSLP